MIVLFLLFLLQFSLACACLAVNSDQEMGIASSAWGMADNNLKDKVQRQFDCCGFTEVSLNSTDPMGHPPCGDVSEQNLFNYSQTCVKATDRIAQKLLCFTHDLDTKHQR